MKKYYDFMKLSRNFNKLGTLRHILFINYLNHTFIAWDMQQIGNPADDLIKKN